MTEQVVAERNLKSGNVVLETIFSVEICCLSQKKVKPFPKTYIHSRALYICYKLNMCALENSHVEVLASSNSECDYNRDRPLNR